MPECRTASFNNSSTSAASTCHTILRRMNISDCSLRLYRSRKLAGLPQTALTKTERAHTMGPTLMSSLCMHRRWLSLMILKLSSWEIRVWPVVHVAMPMYMHCTRKR